ncbi:hypothetical protein V8C44DRAFT_814 [Trichoderma aethiopicum]
MSKGNVRLLLLLRASLALTIVRKRRAQDYLMGISNNDHLLKGHRHPQRYLPTSSDADIAGSNALPSNDQVILILPHMIIILDSCNCNYLWHATTCMEDRRPVCEILLTRNQTRIPASYDLFQ